MGTTKEDLKKWFDRGKANGKAFMIVACDTYDWEDYPIYCADADEARRQYRDHDGKNMQKVMEVYDLNMDRDAQLDEHRANHLPG